MAIDKLISPAELAETLGISIETVYAWTSQKKLPYIKLGRLVRFRKDEIDNWLKDKMIKAYQKGIGPGQWASIIKGGSIWYEQRVLLSCCICSTSDLGRRRHQVVALA